MADLINAIKNSSAPKKTDEKTSRVPEIPDANLSNTLFP